jgi:2-dehydro-3-deoxyglucarate aldolase
MTLLWQQIPSPIVTEILCNSTLDGVVFDLEHGCFNNETLYTCIQVCLLKNKLCFIRVTCLDKTIIRMSLDAGVSGVIFSTVQNYSQAKELYSYCFYPHKGSRGQGLVRENQWGNKDLNPRNPIVVAQIETQQGLDNISLISEIDFDYFMVGPYDLSASLGCLGDFNSPLYKAAIEQLKLKVGDKLGYHIVKDIKSQIETYKDSKFLALSMDTLFLINGIQNVQNY